MVTRYIHKAIIRLATVVLAVLTAGCELIPEADRLIAVSLPVEDNGRSHVLIEFTGFRCVNCPTAAEEAETLRAAYGDRLIVVAMHPASNPFTQGKYDYTCEEADIYYNYLGGLATTPFPTGNIDFLPNGNSYLSDFSDWPTLLAAEMNKPPNVSLSVQAVHEAGQLTVRTTYAAQAEQVCRLALWLVQDSVQGAQALPDGSVSTAYIHRHMLRSAIGDPWGDPLMAQPVPAEQQTSLPYTLEDNKHNYSIVAVLLDENKQIINARQTPVQ